MKLNSTFGNLNSKESQHGFEELSEHYKVVKYWNSFVNLGQLYLITIQCTRLLGNYESFIYRPDHSASMPEHEIKLIKELTEKCKTFLESEVNSEKYEYEVLCYRILYGALLLLSGEKNIRTGVEELESVLISYQQVNLNTETDSIFMCLMLGYFSLKEYERCAKTFKRYSKSIKDKPVFDGNNVKIHGYYYLSQWLTTHSKQYRVKLRALLADNRKSAAQNAIMELIIHFKIPD